MAMTTRPNLREDQIFSRYLQQVHDFPMLTAKQEASLVNRWREHRDAGAANQLATSHLRLVVKIAIGYRNYGLSLHDLIAEGNIGLMQAITRFEPTHGARFATYASWWIRAAVKQHVLHNWSMVKLGTTAAQKKLFFNLRRLKAQMQAFEAGDLSPENARTIAIRLSVPVDDVIIMNRRLSGPDFSLNAPLSETGDAQWQDSLTDESDNQETALEHRDEVQLRRRRLSDAMSGLTERERGIISERYLNERPMTLRELGQRYDLSNERIRQIEGRALAKLRVAMKKLEAADDARSVGAVSGPHPWVSASLVASEAKGEPARVTHVAR